MGLLKTIISAKAVEKVVDHLNSKNRLPAGQTYSPAGKAISGRSAALATAATSLVKRNPKLAVTFGAAGLAVMLAGVLVKRKQAGRTPY
jgi:hypothetical protein